MTINRTTLLDLPLPVTGTESGTWGDTTNNGLTQYMDIAIAGMSNLTSANFTAGAVTIETTEGTSSATNIVATSAQYAGFRVTSLAQNSTITVGNTGTSPARSYRLINADATYTLTFKATGQTGVTLLPGQSAVVAFNGTDYVIVGMVGAGTATDNAVARFDGTTGEIVQNSVVTIADTTGDVAGVGALTASGNLTLSGGTANGVLYLNGSKVATSGSALTFDGVTNKLGFQNAAANGYAYIQNAGAGTNTDLAFFQGATEAMRLTSTGLGIGTSSPNNKLVVSNSGANGLEINPSSGVSSGAAINGYNRSTVAFTPLTYTGLAHYFQTGSTPSTTLTLDSSGNLGLGVTPSAWATVVPVMQIGSGGAFIAAQGSASTVRVGANAYYDGGWKYVTTAAASNYQQLNGEHLWFTAPSGTAGNAITFTQAMTLDASGNLVVGGTSAAYKIHSYGLVGSESTLDAGFVNKLSGNQALYLHSDATGSDITELRNLPLFFKTNATERARITSGGYFKASNDGTYANSTGSYHELVSNSSRCFQFRNTSTTGNMDNYIEFSGQAPNNTSSVFLYCIDSTNTRLELRSNGGLANYSANNVNLASDERLKKDIAPLDSTWSKVKDIEVVNFRYKDCNEGDPALYGVIAQQVQPIVPELVVVTREATETDPEYYGIREQPMYWLAIKALQEAMTRIETLEAKVAQLEGTQP